MLPSTLQISVSVRIMDLQERLPIRGTKVSCLRLVSKETSSGNALIAISSKVRRSIPLKTDAFGLIRLPIKR